jgi:glycosyltransferase involved in cell wall biosynthesis
MSLPTLSVVTPSYNQAEFIETTIRSVLEESYPGIDYLVMDGGSSDGTVEILRRYEDQLRFVSEKDGGQSAAVNEGFRRTSGEIIGWINSDDYYAPGALNFVGRYFADHPEVDWLLGRCPIIDRHGNEWRGWVTRYKEFFLHRYNYNRLIVENFISQPAVFFRRSLLERSGPLDPAYHCAMDYHLWLRMGALSRPAVIDRVLAYFRVYGVNKMSAQFELSFAEDLDAARRVAGETHPLLLRWKEVNRWKLVVAYKLLAKLSL